MVRNICKDPFLLSRKAEAATTEDAALARDLLDTLKANADRCVGMAANMIGVPKNIIAVNAGSLFFLMYNPVITGKSGSFRTEEGCLSLEGVRPCTRYRSIEVDYQDELFRKRHMRFNGWTAQIIQHECDHLTGTII